MVISVVLSATNAWKSYGAQTMKIKSQILKDEIVALKPSSEITVSQWAERYRIMTPFDSPAAGQPFNNDRVPYLRQLMDWFSAPKVRMIVFKAGTQIGKTNAMMCMLAWSMAERPGPIMLALPTSESVERFSATRIDPMVQASPILKNLQLKKWKISEKHYAGGVLYLASAQSSSQLSSSSVEVVFADELKDWPSTLTAGDPVKYLIDRTKTFPYTKKIVMVSSPSVEDSPIAKYHQSCESQAEYYIPCPYCGKLQVLEFGNLKFGEDKFPFDVTDKDDPEFWIQARKHAFYQCPYCEGAIDDYAKPKMLRAGKWLRADETPVPEDITSIGVRLNSLNSLDLKWGDIAYEFLECRGDRTKLKNFITGWLAEEWAEDSVGVETEGLKRNVCELAPVVVPETAVVLTAGIDVQRDRFYYSVFAWDKQGTGWMIHYGLLSTYNEVKDLVFKNEYPINGSDQTMGIWRAAIDTGGNTRQGEDGSLFSQTEATYEFIRQHSRGKIFGIKGMGIQSAGMRVKLSILDKMPSGKAMPGGLALYHLNVDEFKDTLFWRLAQDDGDSQRLFFHSDTGNDWFKHLSAEKKVVDKKGKWEWKKISKRNDYLDTCVYNLALIDPQFGGGLRMVKDKVGVTKVDEQFAQFDEDLKQQSRYLSDVKRRTQGGWLRRRQWQ